MKTQKKIEQLVDELNAKALSSRINGSQNPSSLTLMLNGVKYWCDKERQYYKRVTAIRRITVNALSCIVILLCIYHLVPHSNQYAYVFDGNLINHTETINNINRLFVQ